MIVIAVELLVVRTVLGHAATSFEMSQSYHFTGGWNQPHEMRQPLFRSADSSRTPRPRRIRKHHQRVTHKHV